jgi:hypothetical protein
MLFEIDHDFSLYSWQEVSVSRAVSRDFIFNPLTVQKSKILVGYDGEIF